ncbi:NF038122 family metalloprotease [Sphingomonas nostoxanthinifaciens]|uniref:NF038122 family metalloprotease n=1 Tax=Sphingomonas nostoxanthinifaciens TaxID=2872652 RepID=UPI001CC1D40B|nr:NF038122 family metalloprotease [Sphingomonas nostoxanthinifaciens]
MTINLIDAGGVTGSPAEQGFRIAASYWESVISTNATINFDVGYAPLAPRVLGQTGSSLEQFVSIAGYENALKATGTSALDKAADAYLPKVTPSQGVTAIVSEYLDRSARTGIDTSGTRVSSGNNAINETMAINSTIYKALTGTVDNSIDASITFSSNFNFDFNPSDGITTGAYDFIGVAIHEMGHALGFISAADDFDYSNGYSGDVNGAWWAYALDLFRYSGTDTLNWAPGQDSYFSIDGGATQLFGKSAFAQGEDFGTGYQASHWLDNGTCSNFEGIMNPYLCSATNAKVSALDLAAMDAIGWNLNVDVLADPGYSFSTAQAFSLFGVPEPATWAMMLGGFGLVGGAMRRRQRTTVRFA